jgi:hypothetical protein
MPRKQRRLTGKTMTATEIDVYASYLKGEESMNRREKPRQSTKS